MSLFANKEWFANVDANPYARNEGNLFLWKREREKLVWNPTPEPGS